MISSITSINDTCSSYRSVAPPKRVRQLINDLERKLFYLPMQERVIIKKRINAIKITAQMKDLQAHLINNFIQIFKAGFGIIGGPVGSAIANFAMFEIEQRIKKKQRTPIVKSHKIAGRRVSRSIRGKKRKTSTAMIQAIKAAAIGTTLNLSGINIFVSSFFWGSLGRTIAFFRS